MTTPIRVLIADDHVIARRGVCSLLSTEPNIEVAGEARDGQEAVSEAKRLRPDVIIMDLVMPQLDGIEAIRRIVADRSDARILVLTSFDGDDKLFPALKAGAVGYLLKDTGPEELVRAIEQVRQGESSIDPIIARRLLKEFADVSNEAKEPEPLTNRELGVLRMVAQGRSNQEIADDLCQSPEAVLDRVEASASNRVGHGG